MKKSLLYFFPLVFLFSCAAKENRNYENRTKESSFDTSAYFTVEELNNHLIAKVVDPLDLQQTEQYILTKAGTVHEDKKATDGLFYITVPVKKVACLSTSHIGFLSALGLENSIEGTLNPEFTYSPILHNKYKTGHLQSLGGAEINFEKLIELDVDLVFASVYDAAGMKKVDRIRDLGIDVVLVSEFMEEKPLQKAEWIKFFSAFYPQDVQERADSIYREIEENYRKTASLLTDIADKPSVMTGLPWGGAWFVPGGNSFQSAFIDGAGAEYIFNENKETNSFVVDFELMLQKAMNVDYWINVGDAESLEEIKAMDQRFSYFKAFDKGMVYNNNARKNESGGNDYWESGVVRPDIVLKDLIKIFHPELLPKHQLFYYQQLEKNGERK